MAPKTAKQQFLVIASAALFFGSTAAAAIQFVVHLNTQSTPVVDDRILLQQQAQGYEAILQSEPDNQAALEGLMRSRMALDDPRTAEPLTRLIELHPQREDYANLMRRLKAQQAGTPIEAAPISGSGAIESLHSQ
ncbi:MAG: tetratricopeptide repeat protein [Leptolyngbyaceae cyanobacterium SM1_3_5]|nr:tetratricopeptide repeat protein [Leptolyngbyaceae cyanobacterium SM1_3_5]